MDVTRLANDCQEHLLKTVERYKAEGQVVDRNFMLYEGISDLCLRDDLTFEELVQCLRELLTDIEHKSAPTKTERCVEVLNRKNEFIVETIKPTTGQSSYSWQVSRLTEVCRNEGLTVEDFLEWYRSIQ